MTKHIACVFSYTSTMRLLQGRRSRCSKCCTKIWQKSGVKHKIGPETISEGLKFKIFLEGMPPDPPSGPLCMFYCTSMKSCLLLAAPIENCFLQACSFDSSDLCHSSCGSHAPQTDIHKGWCYTHPCGKKYSFVKSIWLSSDWEHYWETLSFSKLLVSWIV